MSLSGKKVLVTGATGFIGGRLIENLISEHGADVRALVHRYNNGARIARFPLEMMAGDIADADTIERAVAGCEVVFHLAHDPGDMQHNLDAARILAEACLRHGVQRLVYTSTSSIYEPFSDGDLDESAIAEPSGWAYGDCKIAVEQEFLKYSREQDLPVAVLLPTMVYGPFGKRWTATPVNQLLNGQLYLPNEGEGLCNPVFVDDVVDALVIAAQKDEAIGERFLISGPESVTWKDFFSSFERILGINAQVHMSGEQIEHLNRSVIQNIRLAFKDPFRLSNWKPVRAFATNLLKRPAFRNGLKFVRDNLGDGFTQKVKGILPRRLYIPDGMVLALYSSRCNVKIDKARRVLGYEPRFNFEQGMEKTAQFIRWSYFGQPVSGRHLVNETTDNQTSRQI